MSVEEPLVLSGSPGSPYTRKMLAVLRYRRIAYRFLAGSRRTSDLPQPKVRLLPTFYLPDESGELQAVTDSSPIIRRLEHAFGPRPVVPANPALAFLDALIEDYGDEWLTKCMFHYRWYYAADIRKAAETLPNWMGKPLSDDELAHLGKVFSERQIDRLRFVGSNDVTAATIEQSYIRALDILNRHFASHSFMLGERPGTGDFGMYGQLTQLAHFDPTPMQIATDKAPRVTAWVATMEDLSGLEPELSDWLDPAALPETVRALLAEIGRVYAPLLLANARALQSGASSVELELDGRKWVQQPFPYHGKCLQWLREDYKALAGPDRDAVAAALAGTGCEVLFADL